MPSNKRKADSDEEEVAEKTSSSSSSSSTSSTTTTSSSSSAPFKKRLKKEKSSKEEDTDEDSEDDAFEGGDASDAAILLDLQPEETASVESRTGMYLLKNKLGTKKPRHKGLLLSSKSIPVQLNQQHLILLTASNQYQIH